MVGKNSRQRCASTDGAALTRARRCHALVDGARGESEADAPVASAQLQADRRAELLDGSALVVQQLVRCALLLSRVHRQQAGEATTDARLAKEVPSIQSPARRGRLAVGPTAPAGRPCAPATVEAAPPAPPAVHIMPLNQPTTLAPSRGSSVHLVGNVLLLACLKLPHSRSEVRHRTADSETALVSLPLNAMATRSCCVHLEWTALDSSASSPTSCRS